MNTKDYTNKEILAKIKYKSYRSFIKDYKENKLIMTISKNAGRQISMTAKPTYTSYGMFTGLILSILLTIVFSILYSKYIYLLLILIELLFPYIGYMIINFEEYILRKKFRISYFLYAIVFVDLFITKLSSSNTALILLWSLTLCIFFLKHYDKKTCNIAFNEICKNEEAFNWAFNSYNLLIYLKSGEVISKSSLLSDEEYN